MNLLLFTIILVTPFAQFASPFTVVMYDTGAPSPLVEGPQLGTFSMSSRGAKLDRREQEAVYDIMRATGNDWATEIPDLCRGRWHGIECMPDKDNVFHVVSLSFGALSDDTAFPTCDPARSFISPSTTKLVHLRTLFFYRCFTDNPQPIPGFLGQLGATLQTLVLRENSHVGPIPYELGNLTRLRILDLHGNNLEGPIPVSLSRITGLRSLDLSGNQLSGSIPNISLPKLSVLDLNQNHLSGPLPLLLLSYNALLKIDLSRNRISGKIPALNGLQDLLLLDLSYNSLSNMDHLSFKNLKSLQALTLNGNPLVSTIISDDAFEGLHDLMILSLSNMNLEGPIPRSLDRLTNLRVLHLNGNRLNGTISPNLSGLKGLSELRLDGNRLIGPVPFKREMVWRMRRKLSLNDNLGLCYDAKSGLGSDLDTLSDAGIGICEAQKLGRTMALQHFSTVDESDEWKSSASGRKMTFLGRFIQIFFFVFVCYLS